MQGIGLFSIVSLREILPIITANSQELHVWSEILGVVEKKRNILGVRCARRHKCAGQSGVVGFSLRTVRNSQVRHIWFWGILQPHAACVGYAKARLGGLSGEVGWELGLG